MFGMLMYICILLIPLLYHSGAAFAVGSIHCHLLCIFKLGKFCKLFIGQILSFQQLKCLSLYIGLKQTHLKGVRYFQLVHPYVLLGQWSSILNLSRALILMLLSSVWEGLIHLHNSNSTELCIVYFSRKESTKLIVRTSCSFRIVTATTVAAAGLPAWLIKTLGQWKIAIPIWHIFAASMLFCPQFHTY